MTALWDPINGTATAQTPQEQALRATPFGALARHLTLPALLVCLGGFCVAVFSDTWMVHGIAAATVGFLIIMFGDKLSGTEDNRKTRIANAVARLGHKGGTLIPKPKIAALSGRIRNMLVLRAGGSIPLILTHELWGDTAAGTPFWMGLSTNQSQTFFGGPKAGVAVDPSSSHGEMAMLIVAYRLDRDTRLRAEIMPEFATAIGPMDRDIKTESAEFNRFFNIRLTMQDGLPVTEQQATAGLMQVLTPAFQVVLIGLAELYAARVIIDHDTVFFGGYRNLQTTDDAALGVLLQSAIEDFADAATAFKTYAE